MWIKPDCTKTLEDLVEEVKPALIEFEKQKSEGTLVPMDDLDKTH
jgi:hypothetical protein